MRQERREADITTVRYRLLQLHDRVPGDAFRLTQEYLALLLGWPTPP